MRRRCAELGLPFEPPTLLSNSRLVIEAAEFARDAGKHAEFHRAALAAYFAHGRDIGEREVLAELALEVGLDTASLRQALDDGRYAGRHQDAHEEACRLGITGVPTYIFADGARVVGAQPLDAFRRLVTAYHLRTEVS
jgi:predicted DsbA family dithiol-disulfide isomerase